MKTQNLNLNLKSNAPLVDRSALLLHEQLALKRLKELQLEARKSSALKRGLRMLGKALETAWVALMRRPALTYQVAPGQPPVEWHGAERARTLRALRMI